MPIMNADGTKVAVSHYITTNPTVTMGDGTTYKFITQANICLAWVDPKHVPDLFTRRRKCCGGGGGPIFRYTNETELRRWTNKGGR